MPNFFLRIACRRAVRTAGAVGAFDRPEPEPRRLRGEYSYLLVAKGSAKTIRMSLSREQPPARVERAQ